MQECLRDVVSRHPRAVAAGVVGSALVLLVVAVGLTIAGFTGAQPIGEASAIPSPSPNLSPSPTSEVSSSPASATPTSTPSASSLVFTDFNYPDVLRVEVNGLAVRQSPSLTSPLAQGSRFDGVTIVPTGDV